MTLANDLVQFLMHLFGDRQAAQDFLDNPDKVLDDHGLGGVCSADVDAAMPVVLDYAPITLNASSFDRTYNTGGNVSATAPSGGGTGGTGYTPPPSNGGNGDHAHAVQQLHHVVNNYSYTSTVDDRDTITDQSVNQNIWADGDVTQYFDNDSVVASGDRAVAAGDDVDIEDSNNIEDSYNTDNSTDNSKDSSINAGEDVNIGNTDIDADDSFNKEVEIEDSYNKEVDIDADLENVGNTDNREDHSTNIDVRDSGNDNSINDSLNKNETDVEIKADLENVGNTDNSKTELENVGSTNLHNVGNESLKVEDVTVTKVDADLTNVGNEYDFDYEANTTRIDNDSETDISADDDSEINF
ncbi:IniB N-terminal domain-containing protein [Arthrobacter sp. Z4-13]